MPELSECKQKKTYSTIVQKPGALGTAPPDHTRRLLRLFFFLTRGVFLIPTPLALRAPELALRNLLQMVRTGLRCAADIFRLVLLVCTGLTQHTTAESIVLITVLGCASCGADVPK